MKKIRTNLPGLDPLLHGGLQIDSLTGSDRPGDSLSSIVIVLRGKKGVSKHLFAMQLMHGIARSLGERHPDKEPSCYYYSINKNTEKLNDSYIDFLIADWLAFMTQQSRKETLGFGPHEPQNVVRNDKKMIYEILFDSKLKKKDSYERLEAYRRAMVEEYSDQIIDFISDNILTYNPRTNALHFRRPYKGDSADNLWAVRNCDSITDYYNNFKKELDALKSGGTIAKHFKEMFIKVIFNGHLGSPQPSSDKMMYGDIGNMERYSKTAHVIYDDILDDIERILNHEDVAGKCNKKWSYFELSEDEDETKNTNSDDCRNDSEDESNPMHDVLVIDGFSQFDNEHLKELQFSHLHKVARRMARVTILVLDEREEALCDGDIVIELKKSEDRKQEYTYHELQIVKSSFQEVANGWHQYKVQPDGIKVFPSIHFLLSKRYYLKSRTHEIGQGMLDDSFEEYLDSMLHMANSNPCDKLNIEEFLYEEYNKNKDSHHKDLFMKILENHRIWHHLTGNDGNAESKEALDILRRMLIKVLFGNSLSLVCPRMSCGGEIPFSGGSARPGLCERCDISYHDPDSNCHYPWHRAKYKGGSVKDTECICGWDKRYPTTVIIGNPNSFKRRMALGKAYHWARRKEHVLIVLFGKNDDMLRKQLICPALQRAACADKVFSSCDDYGQFLNPAGLDTAKEKADHDFGNRIYNVCSECEKYIHFFRIRMGCITAEEFFFRLEEQIRIYSDEDPETGIEKSRLHIVIDDLQRVDFGFPFFGDTALFTGALLNLCHEHKAELTMLCDKHSTRTKEVCALSDNVIVMDRKKDDINNVRMYVEKCVEFPAPGAIIESNICDVLNLFSCSCIGNTYIDPDIPNCVCNNGKKNDKMLQPPAKVAPGLSIDFSRIYSMHLIGSMREFWRQTTNEVIKTDPKDSLRHHFGCCTKDSKGVSDSKHNTSCGVSPEKDDSADITPEATITASTS